MTLTLLLTTACPAALSQTPYKVLDHWKIGGSGGWDYLNVDGRAHRLYVSHGTQLEVLDTTNGKIVGTVTGLTRMHGVALDADGRFGYISDGGANAVVIFDLKTMEKVASIPAGTNPDTIRFEPATKTVWAFNGRSGDITVIDIAARKAVATIKLPGKPEEAVATGSGTVYSNIESQDEIVRIDAASRAITATWKLPHCDSPGAVAYDPKHDRLFATCDGKVMAAVDAKTGQQIASAAIGDGTDGGGYSPEKQVAFASNGEGTLSVVDAQHGFKTIESLPTKKGARTMTYDPVADRVYTVTADFGPAPAATPQQPRPRPSVLPDSFEVLVIGR